MSERLDVTGERYGKLVAIRRVGTVKKGSSLWEFQCDCGNLHQTGLGNVRHNGTTSCGCHKTRRHNLSRSPEYNAWSNMIKRCTNPTVSCFRYYGGRGISVCKRWMDSFDDFLSDMGKRPEGYSLDRIDSNGNYCPENCRWSTKVQQVNNRRNNLWMEHEGKRLTMAQWAREKGMSVGMIRHRVLILGMSHADALTSPNRYKNKGRGKFREAQRGMKIPVQLLGEFATIQERVD